MGIAVARYTAIAEGPPARSGFLLSGFILAVAPAAGIVILGSLLLEPLSALVFGDRSHSPTTFAVLLFLLAHSVFVVVYAFYRGTDRMGKANLWDVAAQALAPLVIASVFGRTAGVHTILTLMSVTYFLAIVPLTAEAMHAFVAPWAVSVRAPLRELFRYGLPRVPGGVAFAGILATGPFLAPRVATMQDAGFLAVAQSILTLAGTGATAFGLIILPKATQQLKLGNRAFLKERVGDIVVMVLQIGLFASIHIFLWSNELVVTWLGPEYERVASLARIFVVGLVPYLLYVMLRSVIDAIEQRAINTYNLYVALAATLLAAPVLTAVGLGATGLAVATTFGLATLGVRTVSYLYRQDWIAADRIHLKGCLALNTAAAGLVLGFKAAFGGSWTTPLFLIMALALEIALALAYYALLRRMNIRWIVQLERRLFVGGGSTLA